MPPLMNRFPGGPNNLAPYHQFTSHAQSHPSNQHPSLGNHNYLNPSAQLSPFGGNGALGLAGGLNGGVAFGMGGGADTGLGSQAARMGFQHGAQLQQQQQQQQQLQQSQQQHHPQSHMLGDHPSRNQGKTRIREVWKHNLHEEMAVIRDLVDDYPYIAMDTEFPGVVSRPMGGFRGKSDYHYQCLRTNVDLLKVIQIGITLFNEEGQTPPARPISTDSVDVAGSRRTTQGALPLSWQFNFNFSLNEDMYNQTSIESLMQAGIDFSKMEQNGIEPVDFAALLIPSGLVCFDTVHWISFHGGYDFGYLTKLLHCKPLPSDEIEFDQIMKRYFPSTYDVKHLMKHAIKLHNSGMLTPQDPSTAEVLQKFEHKSGLENIAEALKVKRVGAAHQAGSDSLVTGKVFFQIREKVFNADIPSEHIGKVWGLMVPDVAPVHMGHQHHDSTPPNHHHNNSNNTNSTHGHQNGVNGAPSTPNTGTVGLVTTPAAGSHNTNSMGAGPMTPGGGGGFGNFSYTGGR